MPRKTTSQQSPIFDKIFTELNDCRNRLATLEQHMGTPIGEGTPACGPGGEGSDVNYGMSSGYPDKEGFSEYGSFPESGSGSESDLESARVSAISTISEIGMARRAIYGYAMLLNEMGISKDQKQMVKEVEASISSVMRLMQTIRMAQIAMEAFEAGSGPMGWLFLAMAGGTMIASLTYGQRALGGK